MVGGGLAFNKFYNIAKLLHNFDIIIFELLI